MKGLIKHRQFWTNPFIVLTGSISLFFVCQFITALGIYPLITYIKTENYQLALFISINVLVLFAIVATVLRLSGLSWRHIGWVWPKFKQLLQVLPALVIYFTVSLSLVALASVLLPSFDANQAQDVGFKDFKLSLELLAGFVSLVIITPLFEETIFRGVLFKGLRYRLPFWLSAVVSSLVFAVAHGQWNVAIDTFAMGVTAAFLLERSGSIFTSILLHALKNGLAFSLLFLIK